MKLVCSQPKLNTALQLVSKAVASRPTHPVLANVLLAADSVTGRFSLTGFDLNLGIQTAFSASVEKSGAITLPARLLSEIVSRLSSDSSITLDVDESGEQVELFSLNGSYQMRGMPADDFPDLPLVENGTTLKLKSESLLKSIKSTLFASSSDEAKQLLTGVHLLFNGDSIESAATDGHRLAVLNSKDAVNLEESSSLNNSEENSNISVTLPSRSLREVEKLLAFWDKEYPVSVFFDKAQVVFSSGDQIVTTRTLEGIYPNYNQLIPNDFSRIINVDKNLFISALERVAVLADQHNNVVKIKIDNSDNQLVISADAQDVGSASESVPAMLEGETIQIAFNVRYVLEGLKSIESKKINIKCNAPTTPAIISPDDNDKFIYLIMPVQIKS